MVLLEPRKRHRFENVFAEAGFTASAQVLFHAVADHCNAFDRVTLAHLFHKFVASHIGKANITDKHIEA
jgi:hypothetical protein